MEETKTQQPEIASKKIWLTERDMLAFSKPPRQSVIPADVYSFRSVSKSLITSQHRFIADDVKELAKDLLDDTQNTTSLVYRGTISREGDLSMHYAGV